MKTRINLVVAILLLPVALPLAVSAQTTSPIDTFMVLDTVACPGKIVPIQFFVVNDSSDLAGIVAYFTIDDSLLTWVGEWDYYHDPPQLYVKYDTLPRAQLPGLFEPFSPLSMPGGLFLGSTQYSVLVGAGYDNAISIGRGAIIQFYVKVREDALIGAEAVISVFNPADEPPYDDPRMCQYANQTGEINVFPTLVSGSLTVVAPLYGDCDDNGVVEVADIMSLVEYIFQGSTQPNPLSIGDVNCDGLVNIADVVYLINYIFGSGPSPGDPNGDGVPDC
ncbi:MAG: dockerin type I repeat-containing protein [candidate division Zixibacteria bacterium]|nr:dockerin type I repeat-containing protein [candidate division Zixibacteria bacterium]